jgi:phosphotransferase system, enzyme I, PtsP
MQSTALQILKSISEIIAANDDLSNVLADIVEILAKNLDTDVCSVYIYHEETDELVLAATCGLNSKSIGKICLKPGAGITGAAFINNDIINVASAEEHENFHYVQNSGEDKYKSFLSSPLIIGNKIVGVLNLQRIIEEKFSVEIVDMVQSLSTQVANLILSSKMLSVLSLEDNDTKEMLKGREFDQIILKGVSVNPGIAIGKASLYQPRDSFDDIIPDTALSPDSEIEILEAAIQMAKKETVDLEAIAVSLISEADASIFDVHLMFLEDKSLIDSIKKIIQRGYSVEYAIKNINSLYQNRFKKMNEEIFREKGADFKDVMLRLLKIARSLKKSESGTEQKVPENNEIIVAKELLPSEIFRFTSGNLLGIATEKGSSTSHVAILAKALNIPALLGIKNLMAKVKDSSELILDCNAGITYINPNDDIRERYDEIIEAQMFPDEFIELAPGTTKDGKAVNLRANISLVSETPLMKKYGAKGIGLYRTEFLYMIRDYLPSEDVQYRVFSSILKQADNEEVAFRLLDIGGDKQLSYLKFAEETNPALGQRGIRLLLERQDILRPHLRAILRAGAVGKIKIICPMVSNVNEILQFKKILEESKAYLNHKKINYTNNYKLGIMLEIPSAFLQLKELIREVDCVSIGTNDLFQYTFAIDRENNDDAVAPDYMTPAFIKMIAKAAKIVNSIPGKEVTICGEMAGDPLVSPLLIGAGIYDLSMQSTKIPHVKNCIRKFTIDQCRKLLDKAIQASDAEAVLSILNR